MGIIFGACGLGTLTSDLCNFLVLSSKRLDGLSFSIRTYKHVHRLINAPIPGKNYEYVTQLRMRRFVMPVDAC